ncbi:MAG: serine/threonine-protein kinase [Burkholderiales bacterium]|nr:serine/threonine-protein kinase [Burkholderiales bacterium]
MAVLLIALLAAGLVLVALFVPAAEPIAPTLFLLATALVAASLGWWHGRRAARQHKADAAPPGGREAAPAEALPAMTAPPGAGGGRATLGRYRIERELGRGAMGAVYLGLDPQIGRHVAIKTMALGREFAGTELVEARTRFFREAEMAGRLQHPDIVTIFDAGEEDGLAYIAMEFVKGQDLLPHTVPGRLLPLADVLQTTARVAEALAYAHRQGVVHRDIKPANVMVDAASNTVKVTDFGHARVADAHRTRTGRVLGTPSFMSPEQMAGGRVDGRSDLYSLGVMLFQLVTGALPHASDSMARLMHQIANEPAPDVRSLRPELPEGLARAIAAALEKRPELRPADGAQMGAALRAIRAGLGDEPAPPPSPEAPGSGSFAATTKICVPDPRHNSEL